MSGSVGFSDLMALVIGAVALVVTFYLTMVARDYNRQIEANRREMEQLKESVGGGSRELRGLQEAIRTIQEVMQGQLALTENLLVAVDMALNTSRDDDRTYISEVLLKRTTESHQEMQIGLVLLEGVSVHDVDEFKIWLGRAMGLMEKARVIEFARMIVPLLPPDEIDVAARYLEQVARRPRPGVRGY